MCEANVYMLDENGNETLILESVDKIIPSEDEILLESIFSERRALKARIKEMTLLSHRIVLERISN